KLSDWLARGVIHALQQRHCLKKFKRSSVVAQGFFHRRHQRRVVHTRTFLPARGFHSCKTSFLCDVETASCTKLLSEVLNPRNLSTTLENKNAPPPTN